MPFMIEAIVSSATPACRNAPAEITGSKSTCLLEESFGLVGIGQVCALDTIMFFTFLPSSVSTSAEAVRVATLAL